MGVLEVEERVKLDFLPDFLQVAYITTDICHKLLGDYTFGCSSPYVRRPHLQHMQSLNQGHLFPQKQVSQTEGEVTVDYN